MPVALDLRIDRTTRVPAHPLPARTAYHWRLRARIAAAEQLHRFADRLEPAPAVRCSTPC
jgi:hypothetical protein